MFELSIHQLYPTITQALILNLLVFSLRPVYYFFKYFNALIIIIIILSLTHDDRAYCSRVD